MPCQSTLIVVSYLRLLTFSRLAFSSISLSFWEGGSSLSCSVWGCFCFACIDLLAQLRLHTGLLTHKLLLSVVTVVLTLQTTSMKIMSHYIVLWWQSVCILTSWRFLCSFNVLFSFWMLWFATENCRKLGSRFPVFKMIWIRFRKKQLLDFCTPQDNGANHY